METLSNILASFDLFQLILTAFPQIFKPIINAFELIYRILFSYVENLVVVHPGLLAGFLIFFTGYMIYSRIQRLRKAAISSPRQASQPRSL